MRSKWLVVLGTIVCAAGCEHRADLIMDSPEARPLRLASPDPHFRLNAGRRAKILPGYDANALERLLAGVRPEMRDEIESYFLVPEEGAPPRGTLTEFFDPTLQALLEEVWAPMWDDAPDEVLNAPDAESHFPGRKLARQRRENRQVPARPQQPTPDPLPENPKP